MTKSGSTLSNKTTFVCVLVVFMLLVQHGSAGLYLCWGGCLNQCFFLSKRAIGRFPCYVNCLATCFYPPGASTPPSPDNDSPPSPSSGGPAPAPSPLESVADLDIESDSKAYVESVVSPTSSMRESRLYEKNNCIFSCSLQTCKLHSHGDSDLKSCLAMCIEKCNDLKD